jgi:hypothetical protein
MKEASIKAFWAHMWDPVMISIVAGWYLNARPVDGQAGKWLLMTPTTGHLTWKILVIYRCCTHEMPNDMAMFHGDVP